MYDIIQNAELVENPSGRHPKFPLADLNLHDGFDVPLAPGENLHQLRSRLTAAVTYYRRKTGTTARFSVRLNGNGYRVRREA